MRVRFRVASAAMLSLVISAAPAAADERCEAYKLAATGQRISAKLHCRAWAKLTGTELDPTCLDKAEKRFFEHLKDGGPGCANPDDVVSLGAAADEQMSVVVEDLDPTAPIVPSVTGNWRSRTTVAVGPDGSPELPCELYFNRPCPNPNTFAVVECETTVRQDGSIVHVRSDCGTAPESPLELARFQQEARGTINVVTGEWTLAGTIDLAEFEPIVYRGEGVTSADGRTQTGFTTAGWSTGSDQSLWLATTTSEKLD